MPSSFLKLNMGDVSRGLATAVFTAIVVVVYGVTQQAEFNLFTADWGAILGSSVNAGFAALIGYLGKNLLSTDGKVFGKIG